MFKPQGQENALIIIVGILDSGEFKDVRLMSKIIDRYNKSKNDKNMEILLKVLHEKFEDYKFTAENVTKYTSYTNVRIYHFQNQIGVIATHSNMFPSGIEQYRKPDFHGFKSIVMSEDHVSEFSAAIRTRLLSNPDFEKHYQFLGDALNRITKYKNISLFQHSIIAEALRTGKLKKGRDK